MARYAMVTDLRRCVGCSACTAACNGEWSVAPGRARTRVRMTPLTGVYPKLRQTAYVAQCNHCDKPSCVPACPSGATYQDAAGVVRVDKDLCIGCGYCVKACPYDARFIDPVARKVDKCDFCRPRVERGQKPACVATCPAKAKRFGDLEDHGSDVFRAVYLEGAHRVEGPEAAIGPNVYYLGRADHLDLLDTTFPPHAPRLPASGSMLRGLVKPAVVAAVGLAFAGQAAAFFLQLWNGEQDHED